MNSAIFDFNSKKGESVETFGQFLKSTSYEGYTVQYVDDHAALIMPWHRPNVRVLVFFQKDFDSLLCVYVDGTFRGDDLSSLRFLDVARLEM